MNTASVAPCSPAPASGLVERTGELAVWERAVRRALNGAATTVVVRGRPGTGRSALLAAGAELARRAGLHVVTESARAPETGPWALFTDDVPTGPVAEAAGPVSDAAPRPGPVLRALTGGCDASLPLPPDAQRGRRYELSSRPLTDQAVGALLVRAYGREAADALLPAATAATGGNPAVLCPVLRRWPGTPPDPDAFAALADQVGRHHLRTVLAGSSPQASALVTASAVAAGHFSFRQVGELAGLTPPEGEQARTEPAVAGLLGSLVRPRVYDPLTAERLLALLDADRRRLLHERAVRLARREDFAPEVLGLLVSRISLDEPWVADALHAAGTAARRSGDDETAVVLLDRALDHAAAARPPAKTLLELAKAQWARRPAAAERAFRRILLEAEVPDDSGAVLFAADMLTLCAGDDAAAALGAAAARAGTGAEGRTLRGLHALAVEASPTGSARVADLISPGAREAGDAPGFDAPRAAAGAWRHCLDGRRIGEARRLAGAVLIRAGRGGLLTPRLVASRVLAVTEDVAPARAESLRIAAEARRRGMPPVAGHALLDLAELALRTGEPERAGQWLAEATDEVPRRDWHPRTLARLTAVEVLVAVETGRTDLAESVLARPGRPPGRDEHGLGPAQLLFARGVLCLRTGRPSEARAYLRECGRMARALGCVNPAVLPWGSHLAVAEVACAAPDTAGRLVAESLAAARSWGAPGTVGAVHLWSGLALSGRAALVHIRTALRLLADMPPRRLYARAVAALASGPSDTGLPQQARRLLDEAVGRDRTFPLTAEVAARLTAPPDSNRSRLSPAQLRVALLAAKGWSNTAISRELSVGVRTVELHLTHTYRALGVNGRSDLPVALGHP
ncbi:helix-turn-helix transcriptional regulator [Streptomyces sp. NRRL F-4707]|uniref:helix-turn-helix transcriptional regulator n=1 Tax=Streptomyces sp. NRRL F-4707 TaxID=1519496 RepID=UPI00131CE4F7|nr:LuxR C-terminal-related transcriptional regulator [Streptomyces sp. NRRL F-4707]